MIIVRVDDADNVQEIRNVNFKKIIINVQHVHVVRFGCLGRIFEYLQDLSYLLRVTYFGNVCYHSYFEERFILWIP